MIPRDFFPNMPDEVFDMWLVPFIEDENYGWPFKTINEDTYLTSWYFLFGKLSLRTWHLARWRLLFVDIKTIPFEEGTIAGLNSTIQEIINDTPTERTDVIDGKERFRACADFIRANGEIPKPVIGLHRSGKVELVDGNHRIAALLHVGIPLGYKVPMWVPYWVEQELV